MIVIKVLVIKVLVIKVMVIKVMVIKVMVIRVMVIKVIGIKVIPRNEIMIVTTSDLVVEAWAMMFPPMGFLGSALNIPPPSTWATTWLVITTATPYSSASLGPGE